MSDYYTITKLSENAYRLTSKEYVYCELLVGSEKALLIDTGHGFGDLPGAVRKITDKPLIIVNTHGHLDHTSGNAKFSEEVRLNEKDWELCKNHTSSIFRRNSAEGAKNGDGLPENFNLDEYATLGAGKIVPLHDGEVFDLGGVTVRAIATPGHTRGSVSFFYEEEKWLYVGDEANATCWLYLKETTDRATHVSSLDKLIALSPVKMFGSHMPEPVGVEKMKLYRRAATEADYEKGLPFESPFTGGVVARTCIIDGLTLKDVENPQFASVVIGPDY